MENKNQPAFPFTWTDREGQTCAEAGLTKREYFAGLIMQSLINSQGLVKPQVDQYGRFIQTEVEKFAKLTLVFTDELLKQLEDGKQ